MPTLPFRFDALANMVLSGRGEHAGLLEPGFLSPLVVLSRAFPYLLRSEGQLDLILSSNPTLDSSADHLLRGFVLLQCFVDLVFQLCKVPRPLVRAVKVNQDCGR